MSASPVPPAKAVEASRPLPGSALTLANSFFRYAVASASLPPAAMIDWYAARMFQRADPEEPGFGVTTPMPGLARSANDSMCLGLPLRTTIATTEVEMMPLLAFWSQFLATRPASTRRVTSGVSEKWTTSAFRPAATARLWSPEAPYDSLKLTPLPAAVASKAFSTPPLADFGTE